MSSVSDAPEAKPTRIEPPASPEAEPFWEATRNQELLVQWCNSCDGAIFYPRVMCPSCLGDDLSWKTSTGKGTVYAVSVQHRPANPFMADRVPYAVALVELEEGIRMMTNIVECDPADVAVGQQVQVTWEPLTDGRNLPLFAPAN